MLAVLRLDQERVRAAESGDRLDRYVHMTDTQVERNKQGQKLKEESSWGHMLRLFV